MQKHEIMTSAVNKIDDSYILPPFFVLPFSLIPPIVHSTNLVVVLNRLFSEALAEGELDFLNGRILSITVQDARLNFCLTLVRRKLVACQHDSECDLTIEGTAFDFLLMLTRREDADTLFFNRRLRLSGNTELGLYVKNFLAALEPEEQIGKMYNYLQKFTDIFEYFGKMRAKLG
jgi:predicted lipid carrier protein YhbT